MFRRVSSLFHGRVAGGSLLVACLLTLAALLAGPSSAAAAATAEVNTIYWKKGSATGYELQATVTTTSLAETVTLSGGNISPTPLYPVLGGDGMTFRGSATFVPTTGVTAPALNAPYTLSITYGTGGPAAETVTAAVTGVLGSNNVPGLTAPLGGVASSANPTFAWTAPTLPANFYGYSVSVTDNVSFQWSGDAISTQTSIAYNGAALVVGTPYQWAVAAVDSNGNKAENRGGSIVVGANFSGRVTDINGNGLGNIRVQAATPTGTDVGPPVTTNADGTYVYAGLAPGQYKVHFADWAYYWKNRLDAGSADLLPVTANSVISNVNATIGGWGALSGFVSVTGTYKPAEVQVTLLDANKAAIPSVPAVKVPLSASGFGEFYMSLIRPGSYHMRFSAPGYSDVVTPAAFTITQNQTLEGANAVWAMLNNPLPATLTVQTSGSGTVTSSPVGISCASGSTTGCSNSFPGGSTVTLYPTANNGSVFGGWSGACTGTGSCVVTMNLAKNVTATFTVLPATVRTVGNTTAYYSINNALAALPGTTTTLQRVRAKATIFAENVLGVKPGVQVVLEGGYADPSNATSRTATSRTTIDGTLKIKSGKLIVERLAIK